MPVSRPDDLITTTPTRNFGLNVDENIDLLGWEQTEYEISKAIPTPCEGGAQSWQL